MCGGGGGRGRRGVWRAAEQWLDVGDNPDMWGPPTRERRERGVTGQLGLLGWEFFFTLAIYFYEKLNETIKNSIKL